MVSFLLFRHTTHLFGRRTPGHWTRTLVSGGSCQLLYAQHDRDGNIGLACSPISRSISPADVRLDRCDPDPNSRQCFLSTGVATESCFFDPHRPDANFIYAHRSTHRLWCIWLAAF